MPETAQPAAPAAATPTATSAPAAATPPAASATPAQPSAPAGGGDGAKPPASIASEPPKTEAAPAVSLDDAKKYLAEKGAKAEDLAKLDEAAIRAKYDEAKAIEAKPGEIQIKLPEGFTLDEKVAGEFKAVLADEKLSAQDRADKLIEMHAAALKQATEASHELWRKTQETWQGEVKADPEIGGPNFDPMRARVAKAIDEIGGEQAAKIREAFDFTGAGNNPEIIRFVDRLAKAVVESGPVHGSPAAGAAAKDKNAAAILYPTAAQA